MNPNSTISLPEALLLLAYVGIADAADIALLAIGMDDFGVLDVATLPVTQFYFRMKGVSANFDLVMELTEVIPYINKLPLKTAGVVGVIAMDWSSTASKVAAVAKPTLQLVYQRESKENTDQEEAREKNVENESEQQSTSNESSNKITA